ncbi:hypothetical protein VTO42DRAFT_2436 [Malbranchea cinnamomea]
MAALKGPGASEIHDGSDLRIAIVHARWNERIIQALVEGAKKTLREAGVKEENIVLQSVPGSYELPFAVQRIYSASHIQAATSPSSSSSTAGGGGPSSSGATADLLLSSSNPDLTSTTITSSTASRKPFDAIIAIGVLIKGETMHFEYIADAVSHGLMRVQLDAGVPVVFGLLTVLNEAQGLARAGIAPDDGGRDTKLAPHNHGEDWGRAAVELGVKRRGWAEGRIL